MLEDLKPVNGIGGKRLKKIEKYLTVTTETISQRIFLKGGFAWLEK
jgi:hypothetical protein